MQVASRGLELQSQAGTAFCDIAFDCGCGTGVVNVCSKLAQNWTLIVMALVALLVPSRRFALRHQLFADTRRSSVAP